MSNDNARPDHYEEEREGIFAQPPKRDYGADIKPAEMVELHSWLYSNQRNKPHMSREALGMTLHRYDKQYELSAMYRYLSWALENGEPIEAILETIIHDLNGFINGEKCFAPRSESY